MIGVKETYSDDRVFSFSGNTSPTAGGESAQPQQLLPWIRSARRTYYAQDERIELYLENETTLLLLTATAAIYFTVHWSLV